MIKKLEFSVKSVLIGVVLAIILCGANMYLALKIGTTISASIPASILSLGILRLFKKHSILENNISQTIASAGEAIAGVIVFIFPALIILHVWHDFPYLELFFIGICGGALGVVYSVLLRKVLLFNPELHFPEGTAIGKVLLATNNTEKHGALKTILTGMGIAAVINFCQDGLGIFADSYYKFIKIGKTITGLGCGFSPALIFSGFLVGTDSTITAFIGMLIAWLIFLPYFAIHYGIKDVHNLSKSSFFIWQNYIRPIGVGVFLFGGISTIITMSKSIWNSVLASVRTQNSSQKINENDRDLNMRLLLIIALCAIIPIYFYIYKNVAMIFNPEHQLQIYVYSFILFILVLILGFIIAAVAGYMVGLVGSSNSPLSGLYFIAVIVLSLFVKFAFSTYLQADINQLLGIIIMLIGFIGFSAVITNENVQDFKSGQMVGASPYRQQLSLFIGIFFAVSIAPLIINMLFNAYGIAGIVPNASVNADNTLSAPQAVAIALVTKNIVLGLQNWDLILTGIIIGVITFIMDIIGKKKAKFAFPVIMMAFGFYLPPDMIMGLFVGGLLNVVIKYRLKRLHSVIGEEKTEQLSNKTNIFVCGLIAGESLMGLFLAVPFVIFKNSDVLKIIGNRFSNIAEILSIIVTILLLLYTYKISTKH